MYRLPLGDGVRTALDQLAAGLPTSEFRDATLAWLERHYRPEATVAESYGGALAELLGPLGILAFDSTHPAAKRAAAPHLVNALRQAREIDTDLDRWAEAQGVTARTSGITVGDGAALVMVEASLGRDRLVQDGAAFMTRRSRERFDLAAIERIAADEPTRLSPNVLLRPAVESAILPTVAYLGGPGELRYLALTPPVYDRLGIPRQLPLPRGRASSWSPAWTACWRSSAFSSPTCSPRLERSRPGWCGHSSRRRRPRRWTGSGTRSTRNTPCSSARPPRSILRWPGPRRRPASRRSVAPRTSRKSWCTTSSGGRRPSSASWPGRGRRSSPNGKPQERVLTVAPFLARYGPALLPELLDAFQAWYRGALEAPSQRA